MADPVKLKINDEKVIRSLRRLKRITGTLRPLMLEVSEIMLGDVQENFEQQGRPRWPVLADSTIEKRQKQGYWPGKILQMRGELASSVQTRATNSSAMVTTNKAYALIQHFGGKAGRGHKSDIPPRPFMELSSMALQDIVQAIDRYINRIL